ncbi:MAG: trypsin-like peptidase domain-containing protein [Acetobacteraceae bacterium]|nr:trypsin-like peptidase domain-containing protein [Acetobacteraceae bacterium]
MPRASPHLVLLLPLALLFGGPVACAPPAAAQRSIVPATGFADLVERVVPSVVNIATRQTVDANQAIAELPPELRGTPFERQLRERFRGRREQVTGQGSGFVVDGEGYIVTNTHVVGSATAVRVTFSDGTSLPARIVGFDDATDIALLKVSAARPLPALRFGRANASRVGDWILAVGNPYGLGGTVTAGILSARGRDIGAGPFDDFLQTDAPINPGNSGGPLFNLAGEVIGVNTAIYSPVGASVGIGFATPAEIVAPVVQELRSSGRIARGWLGVTAEAVAAPPGSETSPGVRIAQVSPGSPAARAGLRQNDIVTSVNDTQIDSPRALARAVAQLSPGTTAKVGVLRQGRRQEVSVPLGTRPPMPPG